MAKQAQRPKPTVEVPASIEERAALLERAQAGDASVMPAVRKILADEPDLRRHLGDLHVRALDMWIRLATGKELATAHAIRQEVAKLQRELGGPNCPMLEALIIQQISVSYVQAQHAHMAHAGVAVKNPTPELLAVAEQRQTNAQTRLLAAIKQLALVKKLLKPAPSALDLISRPSPETKPAFGGRLGKKADTLVGAN